MEEFDELAMKALLKQIAYILLYGPEVGEQTGVTDPETLRLLMHATLDAKIDEAVLTRSGLIA